MAFLSVLALVCGFFTAAAEQEDLLPDTAQLFLEANKAYRGAAFQEAAVLYEKILAAGTANGDIFYNLGNAYLKTNRPGKAILSYLQARVFMPRDEDLTTNLAYARGLIRDKLECREFVVFLNDFCFWYSKLNSVELTALFLIVNFFLWAVLTLKLYVKREFLTIAFSVLLFLAVVSGGSLGMKIYTFHFQYRGVVVAEEIMVRSGNSINDTVLFKLHEGTEFSWLQEKEGWVKLRLCDGKRGWAQKGVVGKVTL